MIIEKLNADTTLSLKTLLNGGILLRFRHSCEYNFQSRNNVILRKILSRTAYGEI